MAVSSGVADALFTKVQQRNFQSIVVWTLREFGGRQACTYADTLSAAVMALTAGLIAVGARKRSEIDKGLFTLPVAGDGHKGRHFVLFRIGPNKSQRHIEGLRLLYDAMDLKLHTPSG